MNAMIAMIVSIAKFHAGQLEKALLLLVRPNQSTRLKTDDQANNRKARENSERSGILHRKKNDQTRVNAREIF
jgi:creatinine amidohydrolase/Fe(II)-dependent formamide hydrolase-like protein